MKITWTAKRKPYREGYEFNVLDGVISFCVVAMMYGVAWATNDFEVGYTDEPVVITANLDKGTK